MGVRRDPSRSYRPSTDSVSCKQHEGPWLSICGVRLEHALQQLRDVMPIGGGPDFTRRGEIAFGACYS